MVHNPKFSDTAVNAKATALAALLNNGYLRIYSGVQPASANDPLSGNVLLAELRFNTPAFGSPSSGVVTANSITPESSAPATGTATWFRAYKSDGTTAVFDGSVGTSGADLNLSSISIQQGAEVSVGSFVITESEG